MVAVPPEAGRSVVKKETEKISLTQKPSNLILWIHRTLIHRYNGFILEEEL